MSYTQYISSSLWLVVRVIGILQLIIASPFNSIDQPFKFVQRCSSYSRETQMPHTQYLVGPLWPVVEIEGVQKSIDLQALTIHLASLSSPFRCEGHVVKRLTCLTLSTHLALYGQWSGLMVYCPISCQSWQSSWGRRIFPSPYRRWQGMDNAPNTMFRNEQFAQSS